RAAYLSVIYSSAHKMTHPHVRDSDTALWLHNKLGSAEELWIPSSISGIIKTSTIDNIFRCFAVLTTTVKLKLLLGFLHLPRRNLEEMKHMIEGIIEVALEDNDLWVRLVANIVNTYPMTCTLNLDLLPSPIAQNVLDQLSEKVNETDAFSSLPLECRLVNKSSLQSLVGSLPPLSRHFALKRKPKSAALRADLLHKSSEAVSQIKKGGVGGGVKMMPVKHRDMNRRSSDVSPMRGIQIKATINRSESVRTTATPVTPAVNRSFSRLSRQQAGGTKLLDISEQPIGGSGIGARDSKRRKKQIMLDQAAQSQAAEDEEEEQDKTPEYAAGLVPAAGRKPTLNLTPALTATLHSPPSAPNMYHNPHYNPTDRGQTTIVSAAPQHLVTRLHAPQGMQSNQRMIIPAGAADTTLNPILLPNTNIATSAEANATTPHSPTATTPSCALGTAHAPFQTQQQLNPPVPKRGLTLTKEQMIEAQEMFRTANRLTRPEKATILGFMAGSRENPSPEHGDVLQIVLSETVQNIQNPNGGGILPVVVETLFEMDYKTGKSVQKQRFKAAVLST
uniref:HDAg domain-containing protein n=1 Tax=Ciona savignyi TaxID=51511 RepID=H2YIS0_CIOSA